MTHSIPSRGHPASLQQELDGVLTIHRASVESRSCGMFKPVLADTSPGTYLGEAIDMASGQIESSLVVLGQRQYVAKLSAGVLLRAAFLNCAKALLVMDGLSRNDNTMLMRLLVTEYRRDPALVRWFSGRTRSELPVDEEKLEPCPDDYFQAWRDAYPHLGLGESASDDALEGYARITDAEIVTSALATHIPGTETAGKQARHQLHATWKVLNAIAHNEIGSIHCIVVAPDRVVDSTDDVVQENVLDVVVGSRDSVEALGRDVIARVGLYVRTFSPDPDWDDYLAPGHWDREVRRLRAHPGPAC